MASNPPRTSPTPRTPSAEIRQIRKDQDEIKGWMRESKLLLRICTGCGATMAGILVLAIPALIRDHDSIAYMRPKVETLWWKVFPATAKLETERQKDAQGL